LLSIGVSSPDQADKNELRDWLVSLMKSENARTTIQRKMACIKSFYKYLLKHERISVNPSIQLKAPAKNKRLPVFIQEKELNNLLDTSKVENFDDLRSLLVLELLYNTGIRLSELIGITVHDISFDKHTIRVLGKGNKERIIPISQHLTSLIESYTIKKRNHFETNSSGNEFLIVTNKNKKAYAALIYRIVNSKLSNIVGLEKRSPHVLRHSFATHMLDNGAELNAVKELLGHANLAATQIYTHNTLDKLKKTFNQAHPKA